MGKKCKMVALSRHSLRLPKNVNVTKHLFALTWFSKEGLENEMNKLFSRENNGKLFSLAVMGTILASLSLETFSVNYLNL